MNESDNQISSSVLKPSKPRAPLKDLNFIPSNDEENTAFLVNRKRRVSFANVNKIKEFNAGAESLLVCHTPAYEEPFSNSSDSSYPSSIDDSPSVKLKTNSTVNGTYMMIRDENVNPNSVMKEVVQENVKITTTEFGRIRYPLNAINLTEPSKNIKSVQVHDNQMAFANVENNYSQLNGNNDANKHCNVNAVRKRQSGIFFQSEMEFREDVENIRPSASLASTLSTNHMNLLIVENQSVSTTHTEISEVVSNRVCPSNFVQNSTRSSSNDMELTEAIENHTLRSYHAVPNSTRCSMNNMELTEAIGNHEYNSSECVPNATRFSGHNMELTEAIANHTLRSSHGIPNSTRCSMNNMELTEAIGNHEYSSSDYVPNSTRYTMNNMELTKGIAYNKFNSSDYVPNSTRCSMNNMELTEAVAYNNLNSSDYDPNLTRSSMNNMELTEAIQNEEFPSSHYIPNSNRFSTNNMELTEVIRKSYQMSDSPQPTLNTTEISASNMQFTEAIGKSNSNSPTIPHIRTRFSTNNMELTEAIGKSYQMPNSPYATLNTAEISTNNMEFTEAIEKSNSNSPTIPHIRTRFSANNMELTEAISMRYQMPNSPQTGLNTTELSLNNMELTEAIGKPNSNSPNIAPSTAAFSINNMELAKVHIQQDSSFPEAVLNSKDQSINNEELTEVETLSNSTRSIPNATQFCTNSMNITKGVPNQLSEPSNEIIISTNTLQGQDLSALPNIQNSTKSAIGNIDSTEPIQHPCLNLNAHQNASNKTRISLNNIELSEHVEPQINKTQNEDYSSDFQRNGGFSSNEEVKVQVNDEIMHSNHSLSLENTLEPNKTELKSNNLKHSMVDMSITELPKNLQNHEGGPDVCVQSENESVVCSSVNINNMEFNEDILYKKYVAATLKDKTIIVNENTSIVEARTNKDAVNCEAVDEVSCIEDEMNVTEAVTHNIYQENDVNLVEDRDISVSCEIVCNKTDVEIKDTETVSSAHKTPFRKGNALSNKSTTRKSFFDQDFSLHFDESTLLPESTVKDDELSKSCSENAHNYIPTNKTFEQGWLSREAKDLEDEFDIVSCKTNSIRNNETLNTVTTEIVINNRIAANELLQSSQEIQLPVDISLKEKSNDNELQCELEHNVVAGEEHGLGSKSNKTFNVCDTSVTKCDYNIVEPNISPLYRSTSFEDRQDESKSHNISMFNNITLRTNRNTIHKNTDTISDFVLQNEKSNFLNTSVVSNTSVLGDSEPNIIAESENDKTIEDTEMVDELRDEKNTTKEFQLESNNSHVIYEFRPNEFEDVEKNTSNCKNNPQDPFTRAENTSDKSTNERLEFYPGDTDNLLSSVKETRDSENETIGNRNVSTYSMESLCLLDSAVFAETPDKLTFDLKKVGRKSIGRSGKENSSGIAQKRKLLQVEQEETKDESEGKTLEMSSKLFCTRNNYESKTEHSNAISFGAFVSEEAVEENSLAVNEVCTVDVSSSSTSECENPETVEGVNSELITNKNNELAPEEDTLNHVKTLVSRKRPNSMFPYVGNRSGKHEEGQVRINNTEKLIPSLKNKKMFTIPSNEKLYSVSRQSLQVTTKSDKNNKHELRYRRSIAVRLHTIDAEIRKKWCLKEVSPGVWSIDLLPKLLCMFMYVDDTFGSFTKFTFEESESGCKTPWTRFAVENIKKTLTLQMQTFSYYSESRIVDVLNQIEAHVLKTVQFAKELRFICIVYCAEITDNILSLDLVTMTSRCWIKLNIDITSIDIKTSDISVTSIIGEVKQYKVENLFKAMAPRKNMLMDFIEEVKVNLIQCGRLNICVFEKTLYVAGDASCESLVA